MVHWGWGYGFLSTWGAATVVLFLKSLSYEEEEDTYVPYAEREDAWGRGLGLFDHGSAHEEEEDTCMSYEEDTCMSYEEEEDTTDLELVDHGSAHEMQWRHPFSEGGWRSEGQGVSLSALMVQESASVTANVTARPRSGAQGARDILLPPSPEDVRQWILNDARYAGILGEARIDGSSQSVSEDRPEIDSFRAKNVD